jgi:chloramphenicol O-acetyltransferase
MSSIVQKVKAKMESLDVIFSPFLLFLSTRSARNVQKFRILKNNTMVI